MSSNTNSPTSDTDEAKGAFRRPANDAASRKYRRHSPASRSASPDESPSKEDKRRKHTTRDDRVSGRVDHELDSDSHRFSLKSSQGYSRNTDHTRGGKYAEEGRNHSRLSSRPGREPRGGAYPDYNERGGDYNRSRDDYHKDKYNRDRSDHAERPRRDKYDDRDRRGRDRDYRDEKRDYGRSSRDYRSESKRHKEDDSKAESRSKHFNDEIRKNDEGGCKESGERFQDDTPVNKNEETTVKRPKLFTFDSNDPTTGQRSGSNQGRDLLEKDTSGQAVVNMPEPAGNLDAAKVAAMKAAELVNKNLIGTGVMTADQKKKLLWGSKKNTSTEESSHRWDSAIFTDRERHEKFKKLMGVKGEVKSGQNPNSEEKQKELQLDLEKQYTAGLRRRDGRTVGLGL